jgi:glycosyltransferase involved in cell wall biosynthesis
VIRVLNISSHDLISSRFNGYDWIKELNQYEIKSELLVLNRRSESSSVHLISSRNMLLKFLVKAMNLINKRFSIKKDFIFGSKKIFRMSCYKNADIIHLHIVLDGTLDAKTLLRICKEKKVLWTWHDLSPTTGHCVTPMDCAQWEKNCRYCPDLRRPFAIKSQRSLGSTKLKLQIASKTKIVHVTTNWMLNSISEHPEFSKINLLKLPFGLDSKKFYPTLTRGFRPKFGIKDSDFVIGFRQTPDTYKNMRFILRFLETIEPELNITIFTIGDTGLLEKFKINPSFSIFELPWTYSEENLRNYYNTLDIFLSPSRFESFGFMPLEAMACGTRVIGVKGSSVDEICNLEKFGGRVQDGDVGSLKTLTKQILDEPFTSLKRDEMVDFIHKNYDLDFFLNELE